MIPKSDNDEPCGMLAELRNEISSVRGRHTTVDLYQNMGNFLYRVGGSIPRFPTIVY